MMTAEQRFSELGGIRPVRGLAIPVPERELAELERLLGFAFPASYRRFIEKLGASAFARIVAFDPIKRLPTTISRSGRGIIDVFYGASAHEPDGLISALARYRERMPEGFLPIAHDGGGNQLAMQLIGDSPGAIYYWDHNNEWDEEDYLDHDEQVPPDLKWQNVTLIAASFDDLLARLLIDENA
jgi:hypothetical protein